jgi:hypothetical protein
MALKALPFIQMKIALRFILEWQIRPIPLPELQQLKLI